MSQPMTPGDAFLVIVGAIALAVLAIGSARIRTRHLEQQLDNAREALVDLSLDLAHAGEQLEQEKKGRQRARNDLRNERASHTRTLAQLDQERARLATLERDAADRETPQW